MDARAMEDHDWDECGCEIARLFHEDYEKFRAIENAWWDTDSDDQYVIHEFLCENGRGPDKAAKVQEFEARAKDLEDRYRKEKAEKEKAKTAAKAQPPRVELKVDGASAAAEYEKFRTLLAHHINTGTLAANSITTAKIGAGDPVPPPAPSSATAMSAGDIRYKTENAW